MLGVGLEGVAQGIKIHHAGKAVKQAGNGVCFTEETLVLTKYGYRKIKDIKIGDEVYSENEYTGEKDYKKVLNLYKSETNTLINIIISNEVIRTTADHPFYVERIWKAAKNLVIGDRVKRADGTLEILIEHFIEGELEGLAKCNAAILGTPGIDLRFVALFGEESNDDIDSYDLDQLDLSTNFNGDHSFLENNPKFDLRNLKKESNS